MMKKLVIVLLPILFTSCAQNIRTSDLGGTKSVPSISFEAYFFSVGMSDRSRAVFLKLPDADVDIVPASPEIINTTASYSAAMAFMAEKKVFRTIGTQAVFYKGRLIGYLISYNQAGVNYEKIDINLYERGGKVYFSVREIGKE